MAGQRQAMTSLALFPPSHATVERQVILQWSVLEGDKFLWYEEIEREFNATHNSLLFS